MNYTEATASKRKKKVIKGWYFPPEVVVLFLNKDIGPRDLVVLGIIDSHTRTYDNGTTIGCFGTNKYIGEKAGLQPTRVSQIISKLLELGVLQKYTKQDQRHNNIEQRYLYPQWRKVGKLVRRQK